MPAWAPDDEPRPDPPILLRVSPGRPRSDVSRWIAALARLREEAEAAAR